MRLLPQPGTLATSAGRTVVLNAPFSAPPNPPASPRALNGFPDDDGGGERSSPQLVKTVRGLVHLRDHSPMPYRTVRNLYTAARVRLCRMRIARVLIESP